MVLSLIYLIQAQPQRAPWIVWAAAIVLFVLAVSGIVYFLTRLKRVEKEPEEDWTLSSRSLLGNAVVAKTEPVAPTQPAPARETATEEAEKIEPDVEEIVYAEEPDEPPRRLTVPLPPQPEVAEEVEQAETSPLAEPVATRQTVELTPFDDEVWAGLDDQGEPFAEVSKEVSKYEPRQPESRQPAADEGTRPLSSARVDERSRARFEAPRIEPVNRREPFEPPLIEPLKPRETAEEFNPATEPLRPERQPEPPSPQSTVIPGPWAAQQPEPAAPSTNAGSGASRTAPRRKVAGSVLGLPAERSQGPLVLGEPALHKEESGIGSLTRYGREADEPKGHGGTIALVLAILIVAGAVLAYLYVPEFQTWVNEKAARVRNRGQAPVAAQVEQPKASIFPATNPEVNKNIVKARGAVDNRSEEPLEGLFVEVSLERPDGTAETRNVPVTPAQLAPRQRGIYEFEYDGKQFRGYKVMKLTSNGSDVKFISPNQQKPSASPGAGS